jgi:hypothetical protein
MGQRGTGHTAQEMHATGAVTVTMAARCGSLDLDCPRTHTTVHGTAWGRTLGRWFGFVGRQAGGVWQAGVSCHTQVFGQATEATCRSRVYVNLRTAGGG